jgi:hypothetical protein
MLVSMPFTAKPASSNTFQVSEIRGGPATCGML